MPKINKLSALSDKLVIAAYKLMLSFPIKKIHLIHGKKYKYNVVFIKLLLDVFISTAWPSLV